MDSLIIENQNLVHSICDKYFKKYLKYHDYDDLFMEGMIGLIKAAKKFKPEMGYQFSTYAYQRIKFSIMQYLRDVSATGGIKIPRRSNESVSCRSLDQIIYKTTLGETIGIDQDFTVIDVNEFLKKLDPISRKVCKMRLAGYKHRQIANAINLSQSWVSRRLKNIGHKYLENVRSA